MCNSFYAGAALTAALLLAGCMSSGTEVSDQQINQFVRGKTTEAEVIATLGQPDQSERSSDGERADMYIYTKSRANAQSFIPLIGPFIASMDMKSKIVRFTFYKNGVLKDWTSSGSATTMNEGYANQK